ncbi:NUDIX domain-containing protein [Nonomuraea sp. MG754425]|uniref:NUDIX hydrolase n=1 Tax=Nonomuraea sp. MG754425 TaxID=2570319 RepID=UPI001F373880|nr:NUDIX hydrolase [Nonomuraea sp. MG754425]MCF6474049.1 NUDIX domain-containing protein [Nonomuraea sp. MG754425]
MTERSAAGAGTPHDLPRASALPATVPAVTAVPHVTESSEQPTDQRDGAGPGPAKDVQDKAAEPSTRRDQVAPAVPDQRTSTASHTSPDRTVPPVVHGPAAAPEPQAVAELMATPAARSRALPAGPGPAGSPPERVMRLLSQDGAYDPISVPAWNASDRAAVERLMDTMRSPTKDLLGAAGRSGLLRGMGDPGHLLVHTEYQAMGRTMRSWSAVERGDLPAFLRGSDGVIGERRVLRELPFDSPEALGTARRLAVEGLLKTWGYGAGELLPARMAMNMAALDEFGLTNVVDLQTYGDSSRARTAARSYARDGEVLRDFLRVQYAQTQHELSRHGIEELVLYRGVAFEVGRTIPVLAGAATGDVVTAPPALPLQSWSALTGVARRYTGLADGAVMAGVFPASRVLATPWTGMGQLPLHEFVLLAAPGEVTVQRPPHVSDTRGGSSHSDLPRGWRLRQDTDSWTQCDQGHRHWGTEGAAGLLPFHRDLDGEVHFLLHLRSPDTHHGGTWGPVGGARHAGEQPVVTAFREGGEEVRLKRDDLTERAVHHDDHGGWAFDTVIVEARSRAEVWPGSTESIDTAWVPLRELESLNLHPDFARALPEIRSLVDRLPADSGTGPPAASAAPEAAGPRPAAPEPPARERTAVAEATAPEGTAVPGTRARAEVGEQRRAPMPAVPGARDTMLTDGYSAIADPRPRNFAEAAAIVHRWAPDGGGRHEAGGDGAPNRIERLLNGHGTDAVPPGRDPLEHGRDLIRQLPVENGGDAMAETLAAMSASLRAENPRRAICDLAMQLFGARQDVDALVALHQDAERRGLAPWAARDRADLADVLTRAMQQDHHRWLGYQHRALLPASTEAQARVAGLLVEMMGPLVTRSTVSAFTGPLLRSAGLQSVEQLLPLVRAAHDHGHLRQGTTGSDAFHTAMQGFRQMDPLLWDGLLVAEKYLLPGVGDQDARLLASLQDVVAHPETGMGRRVVLPLERLADAVGQAGSVEQLVRLAGDARAHGADLARAPGVRELVDLLTAHRARDPHLWDGLRLAKEYGVARVGDAEARALARLAEITGPGPSSRIWVFDPLRRLADDAGLGPSVTELVRRAAEAGRDGFDLFGPVDRRQVLDALRPPRPAGQAPDPRAGVGQVLDALGPPGGRAPDPRAGVGQVLDALGPPRPGGGAPDPRAGVPGPHDLSPSAVREAREEAGRAHAQASHEYRRAHSPLRRSLSTIMGADPQRALERRLTSSLESRVQAWQRWPDAPEVSFTRDFGAFSDAYGRAVERGLQGEAVIPYLYDDATAALAARDGGRGFGLEIEFDLPGGVMTDDALAIPRALHEAGLTADATVHSYHASKDRGYRSGDHGGRGLWRLEKDRSVIGELVSPILYDEPETWQNLRLACEIIRAHGGTATVRTGGHIHVSTHDYDHLVANYTSVLNYVGHHTDTLYRLGHNPENKSHRGQKWCHPSAPPAADYRSIAAVQGLHGRETAVNTFGVTGEKADHVEFRMWDGSLDPAVIQSQVKVSLALVEAAFRNATLDTPPNGGRHDALGAHADLRRLGSAADTTEAGSLSFRLLMDEIFWRARDKEQLTALYAVTRWATADEQPQNGTPGR